MSTTWLGGIDSRYERQLPRFFEPISPLVFRHSGRSNKHDAACWGLEVFPYPGAQACPAGRGATHPEDVGWAGPKYQGCLKNAPRLRSSARGWGQRRCRHHAGAFAG